MRKTFQALLILVALLVCTASAATAGATTVRTLKPHLLSVNVDWVGQADATTLAYGGLRPGSAIEVLADGGAPRSVTAPDGPQGCNGSAAGSGHLVFGCSLGYADGVELRRAVVTAPDGTVQASLDYRLPLAGAGAAGYSSPDAIGSAWLHHTGGCYHCGIWSEDVDWHTGEVRRPDLGALTTYEDLDAAGLLTPLCAPVKQLPSPEGEYWPQTLGVQRWGQWVLQGTTMRNDDQRLEQAWRLRHCGTTKIYKMPAGTRPVALVGGFVVLLARTSPYSVSHIQLLRLRDRRVFAVGGRWIPRGFAATSRRLLIDGDAVSYSSLWSVTLPQR
jgi:hypothetical protein